MASHPLVLLLSLFGGTLAVPILHVDQSFQSNITYKPSVDFKCRGEPSASKPSSVHKLRPGDIDVVAALGDSITAAFGASSKSLLDIATEFRGESWSIGGVGATSEFITLPNMLKHYRNTKLTGFSTGSNSAISPGGMPKAGLNVAISGAIAEDMPEQARTLVRKMKEDESIDEAKDWKFVTLWIGGNDLCAACNDMSKHAATEYARYVEEALDILQAELPRTFVAVVGIIDVSTLYEVHDFGCDALHKQLCKCAGSSDAAVRKQISDLSAAYRSLTAELAAQPKYHSSDLFTVEYQPFYEETDLPRKSDGKPDRSFFAPDCFHYSEKGHEGAAVGLWNNLFEAPGKKDLDWRIGEEPRCPPEDAYLCTSAGNCQ